MKRLAPSLLLLYPCHLPCPTCSLSMPAKIRRKRSFRTEFSASSCSAHKIPPCCPSADSSASQALTALVSVEHTVRLRRYPLSPHSMARRAVERCQPADLHPKGTHRLTARSESKDSVCAGEGSQKRAFDGNVPSSAQWGTGQLCPTHRTYAVPPPTGLLAWQRGALCLKPLAWAASLQLR